MMAPRRKPCEGTLDLLNWEPPQIAQGFAQGEIRGATLDTRLALAVAATLRECGLDREEIASRMTAYLGEDEGHVTVNMLNAYASQARSTTHRITVSRLIALCFVTHDPRLLGLLAEELGLALVDPKYVRLIEAVQAEEKAEELRAYAAARRRAVR
jgi:hypothetical protein